MPKHIYGAGDFLQHPANRKPVGNGPYRFIRWETNKEIELVRREDYWGEKPHFRKILFKILPDEAVRLSALKTGQIDETRISSIQWRDVKDDPGFNKDNRVLMFQSLMTPNMIAWNLRSPVFSDKRVRQAISMLVDREKIAKNLYFGTAEPAAGLFPWGSWARNPAIRPWPFDPPAARKKLEEAGFRDSNGDGILDREGKELAFDLMIPAGSVISEQVGTLLQGELRRVGVEMEIRPYEYSVMQQRVDSGQFEAAVQLLAMDIDPDPSLLLHSKQIPPSGLNYGYFQNAEVDRIIDEARVEFDQAKRQKLYWRLGEIIHEEQPACYILHPSMKWGLSRRIRGLNLSPLGLFLHYPASLDWWVPTAAQKHR
jgi:peptide/nickel transport system substrate-binding protein